jgi:membrane protease YdiL (CAAX protease family)
MEAGDLTGKTGPAASPHWRFWGTTLWGLLIFATFVIAQLIATAALVRMAHPDASQTDLDAIFRETASSGRTLSLVTFVTTVLGCALIAGIIKLRKGSVLADYLCLQAVPLRVLARWTAGLCVLMLLNDLISVLAGRPIIPDFMFQTYATADPVWALWVAMVVCAPVFEETFFRGFLFRGFESTRLGAVGTVALTALLWAALHIQYDAIDVAGIFVTGLFLGAARARTKSLYLPIALHAINNFAATVEVVVLR